jgi:hypothetical protein
MNFEEMKKIIPKVFPWSADMDEGALQYDKISIKYIKKEPFCPLVGCTLQMGMRKQKI